MGKIVDWNIDDVIDGHQSGKKRRIKALAKVLESKGKVDYKRFLAEMQFNGVRKNVAEGYLEVLKDLGKVQLDKGKIIWTSKNRTSQNKKN